MAQPMARARQAGRLVSASFGVALALFVLAIAANAGAYTYESVVGDGCHESIVAEALRRARLDHQGAAPLPDLQPDDALLREDLPFTVADDMMDIGAIAMLIGVRDNDLKGRSGIDVEDLARVHGDPGGQREHCLRRPEHDEPSGSANAVDDCRAFMLERVMYAIRRGLDSKGRPDGTRRTPVLVNLSFAGTVEVRLPAFHFAMGQALHALQDSFTHTFRNSSGQRITVVLNWYDAVHGGIEESRDGPPHMRALDNCSDADALLMRNHTNAKQASYELLAAALDDDLKAVGREQRVREVLDRYVSFEDAGCSFDNNWCNAPENAYRDTACLCSTPGVASGPGSAFWLALLAGGALLRRLRRSRATAASLLATALCLLPRPAHAHDPALWKEDSHTGFAAHSTVAGAFDNGAFALTLGGRYAINNTWLVGINAEYNPWFTLNGERFARGAFNSYATAIYRYPISRHFAVRTTANLGVSVLLFDLIGAPKGSAGPYLGINLLGLSYELGDQVYLIVDPADVSVPIPKVTGAPFAYRQYRFTLGVQFGG